MSIVRVWKIDQIATYVKTLSDEKQRQLIPELFKDSRAGVQNIGKNIQDRLNKQALEFERISSMKEKENGLRQKGYRLIAGIDEAGRGPLSGPVVAAAVILPEGTFIPGVKDSKQLSAIQREKLYCQILKRAIAYGVGMVDNLEIDRINILKATYKAVSIAIGKLNKRPDCLLIDGLKLPHCNIYQESVIKGDEKCLSIAAASIVAKVVRDEYMDALDRYYPLYNFKQNRGYGTKEHRNALVKHGPCPVHRRTYIKNIRRWG